MRRAVTFDADALRDGDLVGRVLGPLAANEGLALIVAELVNNAVEHGVLGLSSSMKDGDGGFEAYYAARAAGLATLNSGSVGVEIDGDDDTGVRVSVTDSGPGFRDAPATPESASLHGRGLALIRGLGAQVSVEAPGNRVTVTIDPRAVKFPPGEPIGSVMLKPAVELVTFRRRAVRRLAYVVMAVWAVLTVGVGTGAIHSGREEPVLESPAPSLGLALSELRPSGAALRSFAVHVVAADCTCSRSFIAFLRERGPRVDLSETILLVGDDTDGLAEALRGRGFPVNEISVDELASRYHITEVPLSVVVGPDDYVDGD